MKWNKGEEWRGEDGQVRVEEMGQERGDERGEECREESVYFLQFNLMVG